MKDGDIIEMIKRHEGRNLKPYRCPAGKITIGYGRNLEDKGISEFEAMTMLRADILECGAQLDDAIPWWRTLSHNRRAVIIDMCFNLGIKGLLKFKKTLAAIEKGDYAWAAEAMLESKWAGQVKGRAITLSNMMREG